MPSNLPQRIVNALSLAKRTAVSRVGICGVDYGFRFERGTRTAQKAIRFHMHRKVPLRALLPDQVLPRELLGVRCDVLEASYDPHAELTPRDRVDPLCGGISVGNGIRRTTGTMGALVRDRFDGSLCVLSNWHVLCGSVTAVSGEPVCQPGPEHFGVFPPPVIGDLTRWCELSHGVDAAIARVRADVSSTPTLFGIGRAINTIAEPSLGDRVIKAGAVSGVTAGMIDGVGGAYLMDYRSYGEQLRWMDGFRVIPDPKEPVEEISLDGDSGAVWLRNDYSAAVGLHFAGEDRLGPSAEYGLFHPLPRVMELLNLTL